MPDVVIKQTLTLSKVPIRRISRLRENGSTIDLVVCMCEREREKGGGGFDVLRDVEGF